MAKVHQHHEGSLGFDDDVTLVIVKMQVTHQRVGKTKGVKKSGLPRLKSSIGF